MYSHLYVAKCRRKLCRNMTQTFFISFPFFEKAYLQRYMQIKLSVWPLRQQYDHNSYEHKGLQKHKFFIFLSWFMILAHS